MAGEIVEKKPETGCVTHTEPSEMKTGLDDSLPEPTTLDEATLNQGDSGKRGQRDIQNYTSIDHDLCRSLCAGVCHPVCTCPNSRFERPVYSPFLGRRQRRRASGLLPVRWRPP